MTARPSLRRPLLIAGVLAATAAALTATSAAAALSEAVRVVLQKGRHYAPTDLFLHRGDTISFVNGDEAAVHHAFIEADRFSFDAGDQEPGAETRLKLTQPGDFIIQCGIHPKMKLTLHVQ